MMGTVHAIQPVVEITTRHGTTHRFAPQDRLYVWGEYGRVTVPATEVQEQDLVAFVGRVQRVRRMSEESKL